MRLTIVTIVVDKPIECPFNSECQCKLYCEIEGDTANKCPSGSGRKWEFPLNCPLLKNDFNIERAQ